MLISACINACRKRFFQLRSLCDLHEIATTFSRMDMSRLARKAKHYRCNGIVYSALVSAGFALGSLPCLQAANGLEVNRTRRAIIDYLARRMSFCTLSSIHSGFVVWGKDISASLLLPYVSYSWNTLGRNARLFLKAMFLRRKLWPNQARRQIKATLQTKPKGMTHWSCGHGGENTVKMWQMHNIKPHLSRTFKLSRDTKLEAVTQTDPPRVEMEGFKLTHPERRPKAANVPGCPEYARLLWPTNSRCKNKKQSGI